MENHPTKTLAQILGRALLERCPNCGKSPIFKSYLKQIDICPTCHESYIHIHADDAPPWLTILVVGHIIVPTMIMVQPHVTWPDWIALPGWCILTLGLVLAILPRAKAIFIAAIWHTQKPTIT